jgi:pimeloyl-ACP methyl ester carboxylesterase
MRVRVGGEGVPVLFVHPALMNGHVWDDVVARTAGIRPVLPDLPLGAHGPAMERDADLSLPAMARMLVAALDHLGIERAVVVGNDTGGRGRAAVRGGPPRPGSRPAPALL